MTSVKIGLSLRIANETCKIMGCRMSALALIKHNIGKLSFSACAKNQKNTTYLPYLIILLLLLWLHHHSDVRHVEYWSIIQEYIGTLLWFFDTWNLFSIYQF